MKTLHEDTFEYLKPTDKQMEAMAQCRAAVKAYSDVLDTFVPPSPDKTYIMRKLREVAMWANVAISQSADGAPRVE